MIDKVCFLLKNGLVLYFLLSNLSGKGQQAVEENLIQKLEQVTSDSDKLVRLGYLTDYYYSIKNFLKADSLIEMQIILAEKTLNPNLILKAYFTNAGYRSTGSTTKDRSQITQQYIERALSYAKANNFKDYVSMAYANLASFNTTEGLTEKAFKNASTGYTTALNTSNDSAKVLCAVELANVYLERSDVLSAYKTYTNALNITLPLKEESLKPIVYRAIANMYKKLGKTELSKSYINKSRAINEALNRTEELVGDYIFLAKISNYIAAKQHLQKAIELAESIQSVPLKIEAERILFSYMLVSESPDYVIRFLKEHQELKDLFRNSGPDYLNWMKAEIYLYGGQPDSALIYFRKAENSFNTGYDLTSKKNFFSELATCLRDVKNIPEAIRYNLKSMDLAKMTADLNSQKRNAKELKVLYQQQGEFEMALQYGNLYDQYKDSADILGKERDLAVLEIENETIEQQRQEELAAAALERKYNLQYMFITIIVVTVFVLLIMIGMFKVSAFTIRLMGFLSLLFLFEFIILFLDQKIHHMTHGEPWKIWLIKICIISFLLPLHHFLEHKLIRYLLSRHLITIRSRISLSRLFKKKKPLPPSNEEEEVS